MARRGENIRKRKDGHWEGRYIKGRKPDHTAIWGYIYGRTYATVKRELTIRKNELQAFVLSAGNPTFRELAQKWENSIFFRGQAIHCRALSLHTAALHFSCARIDSRKRIK